MDGSELFIQEAIRNRLFSFGEVTASKFQDKAVYYADMRAIYTYPTLLNMTVDWCSAVLAGKSYDFICGVETASLPLVGALAFKLQQPALYLRTKAKGYGLDKWLEGHFQPGDSIYLLDDLSVRAYESMEFIRRAEGEGVRVKGLIVLYEKMHASLGRDIFVQDGYEYESMFSYLDVARVIANDHAELGVAPEMAAVVQRFGEDVSH